ncbi:MAG TPA: branched-chain amino acid ABC transporter permease [Burkholderiaceae bacterium]|nr:branched-chain amino acid ABC transporter permease [Burkholderiaceae bacterium]
MRQSRFSRYYLELAAWLALAAFPLVASWSGLDFYLSFVGRVLIFALAASSLNLVLGYGGMVSLGHAAFFGAGAYAVAMFAAAGIHEAWLVWPVAIVASAALALVIGAISLRTRGVYFIMITLAFAQMVYYFFISLRQYGGEDGINLFSRVQVGALDMDDDAVFYYVVLIMVGLALYLYRRVVDSRFGAVLIGIRENEARMHALGYPVFRIKLVAFVLSGAMAGTAGMLLADHNQFVSPGMMHWTQSANLLIMVLVGGLGLRWGGVVGAVVLLGLEELLRQWTDFWHLPMGVLLLLVVLFAPRGLAGIRRRLRQTVSPGGSS